MPRPIDATRLVKLVLEERDKIPLEIVERYSFGVPSPYKHGEAMRGGIRKVLRLIEQAPTMDYVPRQQWVNVKDGLPEDFIDQSKDIRSIKVLVAIKAKNGWTVRTQTRQKNTYYRHFGAEPEVSWYWPHSAGEVVYWMPLPKLPKEDEHA